jgi:lysophospholipase L1-like esterase
VQERAKRRRGTMDRMRTDWLCFVALGDSFTEGMADTEGLAPDASQGYRGWADRLAQHLDRRGPVGALRYANLAVRGRLLSQILAEQVPAALELGADLVSIVGGGNDVLRPGSDPDALADQLEGAVRQLRESGADVLMATGVDPVKSPIINLTRGKVAVYNNHVWSIARRQGAQVLDLWGMRALQDRRMWAADRIHLTPEGHRRVAQQALDVLGVGSDEDWSSPLPPGPPRVRREVVREDAAWVREYVGPWVGRRLRGRSSGDTVQPKRPMAEPLHDTGHVDRRVGRATVGEEER